MTTALHALSIVEAARLLRSGETSSEALVEACLAQIAAGGPINAFTMVFESSARADATRADRTLASGHDLGPLHGIPVSVKDLIDIRGLPTSAASRVRAGHVAAADAPVVQSLRRAGAVLIGKCNLHEFAFGTTSEDSAFGAVRNPHDPSRSPGGSSGGSAAAVLAGMCLASIGTDTGGSIRIPAAACGVVGLKPSYGEVSCEGVVPLSRTLDHVGPLGRSVGDVAIMHAVLTHTRHSAEPRHDVRGCRLAIPRAYFLDMLDAGVRGRFDEAIERFRDAGARISEVQIPHAAEIEGVYLHIVLADAAAYHGRTLDCMPEAYTPAVRLRLEMGRYVLAEDYVRAQQGRDRLGQEVDAALANCDALILPTLPIPAPVLGADSVVIGDRRESVRNVMLRLTQLFNLTGHPAISLPCGHTTSGLPCALQFVGRRDRTGELLAVAAACEPYAAPGTRTSGGGTG